MRKGFSLVELLGTIAILAILMVMATPAILSISRKNKERMYCGKVKTVVKAAQLYGQDYFKFIDNASGASATEYLMDDNTVCQIGAKTIEHCQITTVATLADRGYLNLEKVGKSAVETEFLDPRNFKSMLNDKVMVYIVNKRMNSQFIYNSKDDGEKCAESVEVGGARYKSYYYSEGGNIVAS